MSAHDLRHANILSLPSVDRVLQAASTQPLVTRFGRTQVREAVRAVLDRVRAGAYSEALPGDPVWIEAKCRETLEARARMSLRPVFNLTGTILHTNLGRALLPREAIDAIEAISSRACNLEFDLEGGSRGDRDDHVESMLCELTGAKAATVVNNNAAAVFLLLNTLAARREVIVSRGELIEIGGSFRMPEIMSRSGCKLREVGTTNRTHLRDYEEAIGAHTALLMKVHTSNYAIQGFTSVVDERALGELSRSRGVPFAVDLGSGALVDLTGWGLPAEPTPRATLAQGANLVTFSGDKLLGGPQCGLLVGDAALIHRIKRNPIRRALRVDKLRLAALEALLKLYLNPEHLQMKLPTLRLMVRSLADIERLAAVLLPVMRKALQDVATVSAKSTVCQIGSGSLPAEELQSVCLAVRPLQASKGSALRRLSGSFRRLPIPVIGRIEQDDLCFDLRCLEDIDAFLGQLPALAFD